MKKLKKYQVFLNNYLLNGGFYIKLSLTILIIAIYIVMFFALDGFVLFENVAYASKYKNNDFQIHVIDVEDGDAILLRLPNKCTILIDTGEKSYEDRVSSYLNLYKYYEKITKIDYLILTHLDSDHIGSAEQIIENYNVKNVYRPPLYSQYEFEKGLASEDYNIYESELYDSIIKKAYQKNCNLHFSIKGEKIIGKDFTVEFLSPKNTYYPKSNNFSAVLMLSYNSKKYLFTGDAEKEIEEELIKDYGSYLKADVLKVGHHGSETSSSAEFLDMVKPEYAIVSSGNNDLPSIEVMDRLAKRNIKILSTSNIGSFALSDNKDNIVYTAAQKPKSYLDLILTIFILFIFVVWKNPFSKIDFQYFKNNTEKF